MRNAYRCRGRGGKKYRETWRKGKGNGGGGGGKTENTKEEKGNEQRRKKTIVGGGKKSENERQKQSISKKQTNKKTTTGQGRTGDVHPGRAVQRERQTAAVGPAVNQRR